MEPLAIVALAAVLLLVITGVVWFARTSGQHSPRGGAILSGSASEGAHLPEAVGEEPAPDPKDLAFPQLYAALRSWGDELSHFPPVRSVAGEFQALASDSAKPLLVVVMGQFKAGKSTLLNALLREEVLVSDVTPATAAVTQLRFAEEPQVRAYLRNQRTRSYPLEDLPKLSAEGDSDGQKLRRDLRYLEVSLPNPLLRRITLVDTPGLNSNNDLHTEATRSFMSRADAVLWVLAFSQAGTATEAAELKNLSPDCRPIAVINQIDQHDPEEETLESVLHRVRRRLGQGVAAVTGVSARVALHGFATDDDEALSRSGWHDFMQVLDREVVSQSRERKSVRLAARLRDTIRGLRQIVEDAEREIGKAKETLQLGDEFERKLTGRKQSLLAHKNEWRTSEEISASDLVWEGPVLDEALRGADKLNQQRDLLRGVIETLLAEVEKLNSEIEAHEHRCADFERRLARHNADAEKYNTSSVFGGPPLLGGLFDGGWGERINQRLARLQQEGAEIDAAGERIHATQQALQARIERAESENRQFVGRVCMAIDQNVSHLDSEVRDRKNVDRQARATIESYRWVGELRTLVTQKLTPALSQGLRELTASADLARASTAADCPQALTEAWAEVNSWTASAARAESVALSAASIGWLNQAESALDQERRTRTARNRAAKPASNRPQGSAASTSGDSSGSWRRGGKDACPCGSGKKSRFCCHIFPQL